jgi:hypothetical protein
MKRSWTALAVALLAIFAATGCNDYGNTFQVPGGATLTGLSPSQVPACVTTGGTQCTGFTLTMIGSGFVKQTLVQWNGQTCPASSGSNSSASCTTTVTLDTNNNVTSVAANISASLISKPGSASVNTINPGSSYGTGSNGFSNNIVLLIGNPPNPAPTISSVSPSCATSGSQLALSVTGTNFLNTVNMTDATQNNFSTLIWTFGSTQFQFTPLPPPNMNPTTITSTKIAVTIPANVVGNTTGNATLTVSNPPSLPVPSVPGTVGSGGGTSSVFSVAVQSTCPVAAKAQVASQGTAAVAEDTPTVSLDGRYVAYTAVQDARAQIFFRDTCEGAAAGCQPHTSLLSIVGNGDPASGDSRTPSMSSDGRYVAFSSDAANLIENAPSGRQIYLRDTCSGTSESCSPSTILVSTDSRGALVGAESILPSVSSSGRFVAFLAITPSHAANDPSVGAKSSPGATNSGFRQVFVRDTCLGAANCTPETTRVSLEPGDEIGTGAPSAGPALSGKASHVALAGARAATLFTRSVPVDDSVFLAITDGQH